MHSIHRVSHPWLYFGLVCCSGKKIQVKSEGALLCERKHLGTVNTKRGVCTWRELATVEPGSGERGRYPPKLSTTLYCLKLETSNPLITEPHRWCITSCSPGVSSWVYVGFTGSMSRNEMFRHGPPVDSPTTEEENCRVYSRARQVGPESLAMLGCSVAESDNRISAARHQGPDNPLGPRPRHDGAPLILVLATPAPSSSEVSPSSMNRLPRNHLVHGIRWKAFHHPVTSGSPKVGLEPGYNYEVGEDCELAQMPQR